MKYSFVLRGVLLGLIACLAASCCEPCDKPHLGDFALKEEVKDWMPYATKPQTFKNSAGNSVVLTYTEIENGLLPQLDNCEELDRCGLCCNEFNVEYQRVVASDVNLLFQIEVVVIKDLFNHQPTEGNENISEYLEVRMNNQGNFTFRIDNLAEAELTEVVTLNGVTYPSVYKVEMENGLVLAEETTVTAIYLTKFDGVIGWRLGEDMIYNLI